MEPSWPTSQQEARYDYKKRNLCKILNLVSIMSISGTL